ncbi:MAG: tetratricopeptide repeat protein [Gemmatimonadetes bacterium]|nr:tetratricopeptide repeat protein [Gemmatimonadota bacterium]
MCFAGHLSCLGRGEAEELVRRLGGRVASSKDSGVTLVVRGEPPTGTREVPPKALTRAARRDVPVLSEREFCRRAGIPSVDELRARYHPLSEILQRYPLLRPDRIRYLETWGLLRASHTTRTERWYAFDGLALLASLHTRLAEGVSFRAVVREVVAERQGQLSLSFGTRTPGATVLAFRLPSGTGEAERFFREASELEREPGRESAAADAYEMALRHDPDLVPALINLANLHYLRGEAERARELYRRAERLGGDEFFQISFNLGNLAYDEERYERARLLYRRALLLEPSYGDAHLYLALTLEKLGCSREARPHWRAYRELDPAGEWVRLAREMERVE